MITLYIDTHYDQVVLILYCNNKILDKIQLDLIFKHSQVVLPNIKLLLEKNNLQPNQIERLIVVNGPGSFTGVRIGVTIAKVMAFSLNIPIIEVSSLWLRAIQIVEAKTFGIKEKNGVFVAVYDEDNQLVREPYYLKNEAYEQVANEILMDVELDYEKIIEAAENIKPTNPHLVKPSYVKQIEALND